jgi:hypothetical protein
MPRFVILLHETPPGYPRPTHFDLLLENNGALSAWALEAFPREGEEVAGRALPAHRPAYLNYEGEISGGRGRVERVESGEFEWLENSAGSVAVQLAGQRLQGKLTLACVDEATQRWRVVFSAGPAVATG